MRILDGEGAKKLEKPVGTYVTLELGPYLDREEDSFSRCAKALSEELSALLSLRGGETVPAVKLVFPAANAAKGTRPFDYKVEIVDGGGKSVFRSVLAQGVELGPKSKAASGPSECVLALSTLPSGPLEFKVYPGECFGKLGRPLAAKLQ